MWNMTAMICYMLLTGPADLCYRKTCDTPSSVLTAEGHKTAGNGSLSIALDVLRNGTPGADKQL